MRRIGLSSEIRCTAVTFRLVVLWTVHDDGRQPQLVPGSKGTASRWPTSDVSRPARGRLGLADARRLPRHGHRELLPPGERARPVARAPRDAGQGRLRGLPGRARTACAGRWPPASPTASGAGCPPRSARRMLIAQVRLTRTPTRHVPTTAGPQRSRSRARCLSRSCVGLRSGRSVSARGRDRGRGRARGPSGSASARPSRRRRSASRARARRPRPRWPARPW